MNSPTGGDETGPKIDWLGLIKTHGRSALTYAAVAAVAAAVVGFVYVRWIQQTQVVASLEFRPTFTGVSQFKYPNGLPFAPSDDVTAASVVDAVYDSNAISAPCDRETFRGAFFVEQRSDQSVFLDLEYQARLSEPRITTVERRLLQEEHAAKRSALPLQYRLVFVTPEACASLQRVVVEKVLVEVVKTWAFESETKRGVLNQQVEVLTPATLDVTIGGPGGLLLKADQLRSSLQRVVENVAAVGKLPGASLIRLGSSRVTFAEVQAKLADLIESRLDPLVMTSGRATVQESSRWVAETVATAERKQHAGERKAAAFLEALQQFSGSSGVVSTGRMAGAPAGASANTGNGPALVPQFDSSFIARIVDMSAASTAYRQTLTDSMVRAQLDAVAEEQRASYYRRLQQSLKEPGGIDVSAKELEARFKEILDEGKALTKQFGDLYDEFSRVSLRAAGALYEAKKPVAFESTRRFTDRSVGYLAAAMFLAMLLLTFVFFVIRDRASLVPR